MTRSFVVTGDHRINPTVTHASSLAGAAEKLRRWVLETKAIRADSITGEPVVYARILGADEAEVVWLEPQPKYGFFTRRMMIQARDELNEPSLHCY